MRGEDSVSVTPRPEVVLRNWRRFKLRPVKENVPSMRYTLFSSNNGLP